MIQLCGSNSPLCFDAVEDGRAVPMPLYNGGVFIPCDVMCVVLEDLQAPGFLGSYALVHRCDRQSTLCHVCVLEYLQAPGFFEVSLVKVAPTTRLLK